MPEDRTSIEGYKLLTVNRPTTAQGGLAIYLRNGIPVKQLNIPQDPNLPELMCAVITINNIEIAIAVLYKRPVIPYKKLDQIIDSITQITCTYDETIIVGDINIDQLNRYSPDFKYFSTNIIEPLSMTQVIDTATRITNNSRRCIDIIMVNNKEKCLNHGVAATYSDHHLVYMSYDVQKPKKEARKITKRDMKNFPLEQFIEDVRNAPWHIIECFQEHDINNKVTALENMLTSIIDKHAPYKTFVVKDQPIAQWMNKDLLKQMDHRDKLLEHCNKTGRRADRENFKKARNEVSHNQRKAKKSHINKIANLKVNNSKQFFQNLKKNGIISDKKKKTNTCKFSATQLNQCFLKNNNAKENVEKVNDQISQILTSNTNTQQNFKFNDVNENEVKKIIKSLKSSSCGVDGISAYFIKISADYLANPLVNIINGSFKHRVFPDRWKQAIVKPIPKNNNPIKESEYRPISLLTVFSKIHEKYATSQIVKYLQQENLQDVYQSAYKSNHSTVTALLNITEDIYNALDDSELTVLVLIDYSKAFDTINHRILFAKLKALGFHSDAISWIVSYLTDRKQKVKTLNDESGWEHIVNGVPQGSVIGPLLFSIMVYDIKQVMEECDYHMYADDTQAYKRTLLNMINYTIRRINADLQRLSEFSDKNCLKINEDKSNYIIIGSKKQTSKLQGMRLDDIIINNNVIKRETHTRNLGIEFDENLTWNFHINNQVRNAYGKLKQLYRFQKFLSEKCKARLVETYVLSQLSYGNTVTQNITKILQNKLQKVQNACYRYIYGVRKYDHITPYINKAKCLKIAGRTKYHALVQMHKILNHNAPTYLSNRITYRQDIHGFNTRNGKLINLRKF